MNLEAWYLLLFKMCGSLKTFLNRISMKSAFVLPLADLSVFRRNMEKPHVYSFQNGKCWINIYWRGCFLCFGRSRLWYRQLKVSESESSDDDQPLATVAIPNNQRGKTPIRRNTIWTRGGSRAALAAKKANEAQTKELELEEKWK